MYCGLVRQQRFSGLARHHTENCRKSTSLEEPPTTTIVHRSNISQDDEKNQEGRSYRQIRYKVRACSFSAPQTSTGTLHTIISQFLQLEVPSISTRRASIWEGN
jgi:hypothetical protein